MVPDQDFGELRDRMARLEAKLARWQQEDTNPAGPDPGEEEATVEPPCDDGRREGGTEAAAEAGIHEPRRHTGTTEPRRQAMEPGQQPDV